MLYIRTIYHGRDLWILSGSGKQLPLLRQPGPWIYQVLPYSVDFKAPPELWNQLSKRVLDKCCLFRIKDMCISKMTTKLEGNLYILPVNTFSKPWHCTYMYILSSQGPPRSWRLWLDEIGRLRALNFFFNTVCFITALNVGGKEMVHTLCMIFSKAFSWNKMYVYFFKLCWAWSLRVYLELMTLGSGEEFPPNRWLLSAIWLSSHCPNNWWPTSTD